MAAFTPSLSAATVFDTADRVNQGEALTWAGEVEDQLVALTSGLVTAAVFTAGALTIPSTFAPGIVYDIDTLAVDSTITLPSAAAAAGKVLWFKRTVDSSYKVTVQRAGTDTIDGATMTGFASAARRSRSRRIRSLAFSARSSSSLYRLVIERRSSPCSFP